MRGGREWERGRKKERGRGGKGRGEGQGERACVGRGISRALQYLDMLFNDEFPSVKQCCNIPYA